jgi:hypothetical protein
MGRPAYWSGARSMLSSDEDMYEKSSTEDILSSFEKARVWRPTISSPLIKTADERTMRSSHSQYN